jgi:hypothetical protein
MRIRLYLLPPLLMLAASVGCSPVLQTPEGGDGPLLPSLQVYTEAEKVNFVLQVTNTETGPLELEYSTGQSFDFVVTDEGGREVWKWSSGQMFTQAERDETLAAGASLRYEGEWNPDPELRGSFVAVGRLTARNHAVEQVTRFQLR